MVKGSQLTKFSKSSEFVQQYALGQGLLSSRIPELETTFTTAMIIVIDVFIRKEGQSFQIEDLAAGTGLEEETIQSALEKLTNNNFIITEGDAYTLNSESDIVEIMREEHPAIGL